MQSQTHIITDEQWSDICNNQQCTPEPFFYGVKTTGIYCVPMCRSKTPKRENVVIFDSIYGAHNAGFRPCKRCKPNAGKIESDIAQACRFIIESETPPSLDMIATHVGTSPHHLHRKFKKTLGITPKAFADQIKNERAKSSLKSADTVIEAAFEAGFETSGRLYDRVSDIIGMSPKAYRSGAKDIDIQYCIYSCSLGHVLIAGTSKGIANIALDDTPAILFNSLKTLYPSANLNAASAQFETWARRALDVVEGTDIDNDSLPVDIQGTSFQRRVWEALKTIPKGETLTYSELARKIDKPKAVRAVASACARNPVAIVVPCHRVLGKDGELRGYRWGKNRKRTLLDREKSDNS